MKGMMQRNMDNGDKGLKLVSVRLPVDTHLKLVKAADKQHRSVNAQINFLIEEHLKAAA